MQRAQGFAQQGSRVVWTAGQASQTLVQETAPFALILVYVSGTTTLATLYADNNEPPTQLANPFTANENGYWYFYAADGHYDVVIEAADWTWTIGDLLLGSMRELIADIDASGHSILNATLVQSECVQLDGGLLMCNSGGNMVFRDPAGNEIAHLTPTGTLTLDGCIDAQCLMINGTQVHFQTPWLSNIDAANFSLHNVQSIGIGTATAQSALDIVSPGKAFIRLTSNSQILQDRYSGLAFFDGASGNYVAEIGAWFHNDAFQGLAIDAGAYTNCIKILYDTGFVGISNALPQYPLDVHGDVNISGVYRINGVPIATGGGGAQTPWQSNIDGSNFSLSNVGSIQVNGNVDITGVYSINGVPIGTGGGGGQQTPWLSLINANNNSLVNVQSIGIGVAAPAGALEVNQFGRWAVFSSNVNGVMPPNQNGVFLGWNLGPAFTSMPVGSAEIAFNSFSGGVGYGMVISDCSGNVRRPRIKILSAGQIILSAPGGFSPLWLDNGQMVFSLANNNQWIQVSIRGNDGNIRYAALNLSATPPG